MFWNQSRYKQDFRQTGRIGKGGFGSVFRVVHRVDMHEYAIKKVKFHFRTIQELEEAYRKVILIQNKCIDNDRLPARLSLLRR
jgi:serine/threonine protein kinase